MPRLETRVAKMEKAAARVDLKAMTDDELLGVCAAERLAG